ncbi:MAG TPA: cyclic nucleotide-binding domain-containing protein [Kofleriaceae bacterium]|nr:cyclic nucleotide-binding domain-containing protein [Kofleriaceae bacterium]
MSNPGKAKEKGKPRKRRPGGWAAFTEGGTVGGWLVVARLVLLLAFAATIPVILGIEHGRRLLWTCAIAALPAFWVAGGYHLWRRLCPLAVTAQLGRLLGLGGERKAGDWLAANYMFVQLGLMVVALSLRLVVTNGSAVWLAGFLAVVVVAAVVTSFVYTGKTWCNYLCPVGMVEKIYTEPSRLAGEMTSQCAPCTACKKHCPDIDLEQGYWKEMRESRRRVAYFAWPGIVLGFYVYYYLQAGTWTWYFGGEWTYDSAQPSRWLEPGFYFTDAIPVVAAAPLTLIGFGLASFAVFRAGEAALLALRARVEDGSRDGDDATTRVRHSMLVAVGLIAFNIFYFFGGQPTLREAPGWVVKGFGVLVVFASTLIFVRRLRRSESDHVRERFARGILKRWQWGDAPASDDLQDIYLVHTERTKEREQRLQAYKETVRDMVADGLVSRDELAVLDSLRKQLGVSDKDHEKVLAQLSDEERQLFDPAYQGSVELRLQREQYDRELERLVLAAARAGRAADDEALASLRADHGLSQDEHRAALAALFAADGPVMSLARAELAEVERLASATAAANDPHDPESSSLALVRYLCRWRAEVHLAAARGVMHTLGEQAELSAALEHAQHAFEGSRQEPFVSAPLIAVVSDASPYLRAALAIVLARLEDGEANATLVELSRDSDWIVREAAFRALTSRGGLDRELLARAMADEVDAVKRAALRIGSGSAAAQATLDSRASLTTLTTVETMMLLRNMPMLRELDPDDLVSVTRIATERTYAPGDPLCRQGEPGNEVFLLVSGEVRIFVGGIDGATPVRDLNVAGAGACIGEMAVLDAEPRSASVAAITPTRALILPGAPFKTLLVARPEMSEAIIHQLVGRLRRLIDVGAKPDPGPDPKPDPVE